MTDYPTEIKMTESAYLLAYEDATITCKIGKTKKTLEERIVGLQTGNHRTIIPIASSTEHVEGELHEEFSEYRIGNTEWFKLPVNVFVKLNDRLKGSADISKGSSDIKGTVSHKNNVKEQKETTQKFGPKELYHKFMEGYFGQITILEKYNVLKSFRKDMYGRDETVLFHVDGKTNITADEGKRLIYMKLSQIIDSNFDEAGKKAKLKKKIFPEKLWKWVDANMETRISYEFYLV